MLELQWSPRRGFFPLTTKNVCIAVAPFLLRYVCHRIKKLLYIKSFSVHFLFWSSWSSATAQAMNTFSYAQLAAINMERWCLLRSPNPNAQFTQQQKAKQCQQDMKSCSHSDMALVIALWSWVVSLIVDVHRLKQILCFQILTKHQRNNVLDMIPSFCPNKDMSTRILPHPSKGPLEASVSCIVLTTLTIQSPKTIP